MTWLYQESINIDVGISGSPQSIRDYTPLETLLSSYLEGSIWDQHSNMMTISMYSTDHTRETF